MHGGRLSCIQHIAWHIYAHSAHYESFRYECNILTAALAEAYTEIPVSIHCKESKVVLTLLWLFQLQNRYSFRL